ncbi:MAG: hypothetical protein ACR2FG_01735 [Marmoricola sp.]
MTPRLVTAAASAAAVLLAVGGCGSAQESGKASESKPGKESGEAADTSTCVADAKPVGALPTSFPTGFPLPKGTVVYNAEDRGKDGVIVSAITSSSLKDVRATLNGPARKAGFKVTSGETEKRDAEASWTGNGFRGRWAIKQSATCKGEVSIQVLAAKG